MNKKEFEIEISRKKVQVTKSLGFLIFKSNGSRFDVGYRCSKEAEQDIAENRGNKTLSVLYNKEPIFVTQEQAKEFGLKEFSLQKNKY